MKLQAFDLAVIILYLALVTLIGLVLKKQAQRSKNDYLLGGKSMPYWMLGISNASGMFDISGTSWMVAMMFVYGLKSVWLPWLWPVFNQIFMMVYLSVWLRRSNASTGAEWMETRFGKAGGDRLAHHVIVIFALLSCLSMMAYGFIGLGKFLEIFIPWTLVKSLLPWLPVSEQYAAHVYGVLFTLFTVAYSMLGGMKSIVWVDLIHYGIMVVVSASIAWIAWHELGNAGRLPVPEGWYNPFFGWELDMHWTGYLELVNRKIERNGFSPFGYFFTLMAAKGILASLAGPAPTYDMQKILSARSPREAALMSMFVNVVLLPTRYLMIIGITVLGLLFFQKLHLQSNGQIDFERILPAVLNLYVPPGLLGLVLVGLMGAFMGTFAGTFNAAQAYMVNDIYLKRKPDATNRQISRMNYLLGLVVVSISILLGIFMQDVNSALQWIVSALFGGFVAANVLKWHWWRLNSFGFFCGMLAGILAAMAGPYLFPGMLPLFYFPVILVISLAASVAGSLLTKPTDRQVLRCFYKNIRPWGFWKPVRDEVMQEDKHFVPDSNFKRDAWNIVIGIIAQTCITSVPIFLVLRLYPQTLLAVLILLGCAAILRNTWYAHLPRS
ncbi:sodium:solute symporter family protein [Dyadobacter sandarakinus]|uniref:Na+:solute symporter n=1 Tax=Dyadobacter sandarakinus TaxID=2747268 RepID=A0ABX7IBW8_9BACT|nr:sodium:solute symporter family protein [Dyadobacter sandarakinus]QRR03310.1 Na+:solute symporter [Dyadobacter sandarakinus]